MKKRLAAGAIIVLFLTISLQAKVLRLEINCQLKELSVVPIFNASIIVPLEQNEDIFAGPYTLRLNASQDSTGIYSLAVNLIGLGPDFHNYQHNIFLSRTQPSSLPPAPVKGNVFASYSIRLLDDTTQIIVNEPPSSDSSAWQSAPTIHYMTHWIRNSLADFTMDSRMSYMEDIYNKYRGSFQLSSSEKIDLYFHPETISYPYIDPRLHYSIIPQTMKINMIYSHTIDVADPRPGAELLMYKLWGYGPRWMVTGFAGYYFDNQVRLNQFFKNLKIEDIVYRLGDESWVDSDTGRIFCGAFAHWILDYSSPSSFSNLYRQSTALDYQAKFQTVYGLSIATAMKDFFSYCKKYKSTDAELGYYGQLYFDQNDLNRAEWYYSQLVTVNGSDTERNYRYLATCQFWTGDFIAAENTFSKMYGKFKHNPEHLDFMANMEICQGKYEKAYGNYDKSYYEGHYSPAGFHLASILLDRGLVDSAATIMSGLGDNVKSSIEYLVESARINIIRGLPSDSLLHRAVNIALNRVQNVPAEPRNYFWAGRALALLGQFDKAKENLDVSYFLEKRPFYLSYTLLELGKLSDLSSQRDKALEYYNQVLGISGGEFQKWLAKKYIAAPYSKLQ